MSRGIQPEPTPPECALASEMFDHFCSAGTMKQILALHRDICNTLNLKPNRMPDFYPKLKAKLANSWKAQALFKKFDARANHKLYGKGRAAAQTKMLIIGAGPCGLRAAIECQLLGAKVVVVEKRDRMSRNNVLHLWPFVIQDLRALGAKKFFGKFCAGSIEHICIRQLQCILLKVALLLGVEVHEGVSFEELLEPTVTANSEILGWRARVQPPDHPVSQYEFDALCGADGKRNTLQGFKRTEFRGKLAMAITANFINRHSEQEASVQEISGVAFIFNQKFFKDLYEETGIDLENIVYYKDDTHYFVMTAKKHSLIDKGVLLKDYSDVSRLLSVENVDRGALMRYAQEAARFSTEGRLPLKDFALNHYGEPDVALFDFTSMYAAENASMVYERRGRRLLCQLVGDSLLEPFWPTGSGCARGFLSALDAAWAVRAWSHSPNPHPLDVIAERESIYRLLAQTTQENVRDTGLHTLDPGTRYPNLNRAAVSPHRVKGFYNSDDPLPLDATAAHRKRRRESDVPDDVLVQWVGSGEGGLRGAVAPASLVSLLRRYRPDLLAAATPPRAVYHVLHHELGITPFSPGGTMRDVPDSKVRSYLTRVYHAFKGEVPHIHHQSDGFDQIKQSIQKEKRNAADHSLAAYANAAEAEKSHSSYKRKRRSPRIPQVSKDPTEYIRKKIGKLHLNDITHLARLIDGHDEAAAARSNADQQKELQEQIIALLDPDEAPDPAVLRQSLAYRLQGNSNTSLTQDRSKLAGFFEGKKDHLRTRIPRRLKGLDAKTIKVYKLDIDDSADTDATIVNADELTERPEVMEPYKIEPKTRYPGSDGSRRSYSVDDITPSTKTLAQLFEANEPHEPLKSSRLRSKSLNGKSTQLIQMSAIFDGKTRLLPSPERQITKPESIGYSELEIRKQKMVDLIEAQHKPIPPRRTNGQTSFHMQRASDKVQKRNEDVKRPRSGKKKAAREIMCQRFERSVQMLAAEPRADIQTMDLENDYGLQQYRASAPQFGERVRKLERQLQHYEEGRIVSGGGRNVGGGARVAKLAEKLSGTSNNTSTPRQSSKPKDLMRSVGKIERDDWNMKEIERKIQENRMGRPEPGTAEKVPKWDREQFLGRQRRLKEGDTDEKWGEIDETLNKLDQKLRDSGRPDHGTKKVASLATKFVKKEPEQTKATSPKEEPKKGWRGPANAGVQCAACGKRVFAAEGVTADGLQLHRGCFRCAVCKAVLRPGNYTMERNGSRLVCLRHSGVSVPDAVASLAGEAAGPAPTATPERISIELSDGAREIDEDEWTDRNFLASETSGAGGLSDEEESSSDEYTDAGDSEAEGCAPAPPGDAVARPARHDMYFSDDSFGYDEYSDDGADSSGNESCSRMRAAREARRREVPAEARPSTYSSEVESEEESSSSDSEVSSATEVSTDSEFAREEAAPAPSPPAILVTEAPPPPPPPAPAEYPLSRARSAGGLATKRALELKRRYLLGEPSPPAVRKSDSTSQIDTKFEAFRYNITEFQKMLNPAPTPPILACHATEDRKPPMPDIIKNLMSAAPVDLLAKADTSILKGHISEKSEPISEVKKAPELESDSLSEDSSHTETAPKSVPRVEVHDEGGELIQLDSLMIESEENEKASATATATGPTVLAADSESSESGRDASTLALTETELSDWAAEGALDEYGSEKEKRKRSKNPRTLSGPKLIHDAKNTAAASHVCGRTSPEPIVFSNALEHFEFVDEGEQDPSIETPSTPRNEGYMELVDDEFEYSPGNDRSMNFIERSFSETLMKPAEPISHTEIVHTIPKEIAEQYSEKEHTPPTSTKTDTESKSSSDKITDQATDASTSNLSSDRITDVTMDSKLELNGLEPSIDSLSITEVSPESHAFTNKTTTDSESFDDISPSPVPDTPTSKSNSIFSNVSLPPASQPSGASSLRMYSPAICRSASETFNCTKSRSTDSPTRSFELSVSVTLSSGSVSPISPIPPRDTTVKVQEIKRERDEQTEVVRLLVLERLGSGPRVPRKSMRRTCISPCTGAPPPVPPPPVLPEPPPPPRPAPPLLPMPVTPSFSDPELARERRRTSIMKSISNYLNRHLGPRQKWASEPNLSSHQEPSAAHVNNTHKSTSALQEAPPVPPPPACYSPPAKPGHSSRAPAGTVGAGAEEERDAMQLWFEARWARLVAQRRAREEPSDEPTRRLQRLERRLARPLSAEQQAATVAELVQVSAQRDAHIALMKADRRRSAAGGGD